MNKHKEISVAINVAAKIEDAQKNLTSLQN
jgi:hypothetical protein